jgi:predicted nucleotidyltransferase
LKQGDEAVSGLKDIKEKGSGLVQAELLNSIVAYFCPRRIVVFGSRARGEAGLDSDLDLLVILDDDASPELLSWRAGYEARKAYHRAIDIVPCRESVFRERARIVGSLAHTAESEGVVVYERE